MINLLTTTTTKMNGPPLFVNGVLSIYSLIVPDCQSI